MDGFTAVRKGTAPPAAPAPATCSRATRPEDSHEEVDLVSARRGRGVATGAYRPAEGDLRARARQGGLLRARDAHVSPPSAHGLDQLRRSAEAACRRYDE